MATTLLHRSGGAAVAISLAAALAVGCSSNEPDGTAAATSTTPRESEPTESEKAQPRLTVTYDGGIMVLDADTLGLIHTTELDGFNRVNPAGDSRHVLVSHGNSFRVLDVGTWSDSHGDHSHHYTAPPQLTDVEFESAEPGHVVRHDGKTVLFFDGSGLVEIFDPSTLDGKPETRTYTAPDPHHGVAVELADGRLVTSLGTDEKRTGIVVLDAARMETARSEDCPGVHGEAVAANEAVTFGCENGVIVFKDGAIRKIASPDPYGRIGNLSAQEDSPIVLGDYKVDPNAELERPTRVSLVNTETGELKLVELGTSYTFRSLGRGPAGEGLVLGTDGTLQVIDPVSGAVTSRFPVIAPWSEPQEWQSPRPALYVQGNKAFVTEPATDSVHTVDLASGSVTKSEKVPHTPNEITGVTG
jgi:hypothetical protein